MKDETSEASRLTSRCQLQRTFLELFGKGNVMMIHTRMIEVACLTILMAGFAVAQEKKPPGDQRAKSLQARDEVLERRLKQLEIAKRDYRWIKDAR